MFWLYFVFTVISADHVFGRMMPLKYNIITPIHIHPNRQRRDLSTREQHGHLADTSFGFKSNGKFFKMDISLNKQLLHEKFLIGFQRRDGNITTEKFYEHCYYHGTLSNQPNTTVVLSTCYGLRGTIHDATGKIYGIEPREESSQEHIFYDLEDLPKREARCGVDHDHSHDFDVYRGFDEHIRMRRSLLTETKYISLVLVNDKRMFEKYDSNLTKVINRALEIGNHVDSMLKTVKARAGIVYVETWNVLDLFRVKLSAGETLGLMSRYNQDVLVHNLWKKGIRRDNVQLLTGIDFDGLVVGMAGIGTICGLASTGVNQDYSSNAGVVAGTVAHELGHNLGMPHDIGGCSCNGGPCVMAASGGGVPIGYTQCSKSAFERRITDGLGSCLFDVPLKLFGPAVCGNGFLEDGEECDCGSMKECNATGASTCCNATTCKLQPSAQCAVGPCCKDCNFVAQGTICRKRETECDLEEACTGKSHQCPGNFYLQDGVPCKNDTAYCFEGGCRTHNEQCEILWGKGAKKAHNVCYKENIEGTKWSSCGENNLKQLVKCAEEDILCGTVQCKDTPNDFPILGSGDMARFRGVSVTVNGVTTSISCKQGITSLGPDLDNPTMTQQGTKCGEGKICMSRKCVNMTSLDFIKPCPNGTCYNGGVCNNLGHCHCPAGYACPDCKHAGAGGSVDSGHKCYEKKEKEEGGKNQEQGGGLTTMGKSLLILFLGVVPVCVVAIFLVYKFRASLPCKPGSRSNASAQISKSGTSSAKEQGIVNTPGVSFEPQSKSPVWINQPVQHVTINNYGVPRPAPSPSRAPPLVPTGPALTTSPQGRSPRPPLRQVPPKPKQLPPLVPPKPH